MNKPLPRLLLHSCCAPCSVEVIDQLRQSYDLTVFYYNPNIHPRAEYDRRRDENQRYCDQHDIPFIEADYDLARWQAATKGHELDPERGERCRICYSLRLEATVQYAADHDFDLFTTTLSISPHKDAEALMTIGRELAERYRVAFLDQVFRQGGGYDRAVARSREEGFYRQSYCGCVFSMRQK